jgi:hypothetical protein
MATRTPATTPAAKPKAAKARRSSSSSAPAKAAKPKAHVTGPQALERVLADGRPRPVAEITAAAAKIATGLTGRTPEATLSAQLYTAAKAGGFVELIDRGTFRLRPTTA